MTIDVSKECADYLRALYLNQTGYKLKASHAHELVAAFFGYKSRAALLAEQDRPLSDLLKARILAPDIGLMEARRTQLSELPADLADSKDLAISVAGFLQTQGLFSGQTWIYDSLADYVKEVLMPEQGALIDDQLSGVMAETNASFNENYYETAELSDDGDHFTIEIEGQVYGVSDEDRPFCGDKIDMKVTVELPVIAGRVAFGKPDISATGEINDDWVDPELKYGKAI
jgi:hypothetical protein